MRVWALLAVGAMCVACVDGTTPDCKSPDSGCFPGDSGGGPTVDSGQLDASDASSDVNEASADAAAD
jgi:hypothetical protein